MQWRNTQLQQRHAVFGTGDQQRGELKVRHQLHAAFDQLGFVFAVPYDRFELRQVWRQQRRAAIALKIGTLWIDQHRHLGGPRQLDHALYLAQRAFGVVRQHQRTNLRQRLLDAFQHGLRIDVGEPFFEVETDQLLVA
ncbi:hypothetical protein D3C76_1236090 [compost metagenome]